MQLLETIYLQNGQFQNLEYHNARMANSQQSLFGKISSIQIDENVRIPLENQKGEYRCRIIYNADVQEVSFIPYTEKPIKKLKFIDIGDWNYQYKYADRNFMGKLLTDNPEVDEVIMTKNGFITDCTIANLAFYDGKNWFTPSTSGLSVNNLPIKFRSAYLY